MSADFSFDLSGQVARIQAKLGEVQNVVFLAAAEKLEEGAMSIHRHAVISIQAHESTGKTVKLYGPKREHDVSSPGNPPNSDLGMLAHSISFDVDPANLTAVVGTNLKYGAYLEMGTTKMAARPWLFPAFDAHREEVKSNIAEAVTKAMQGRGA